MLNISSKQMAALSEDRKEAFLARLAAFISAKTGRQPEPSLLEELFDRGTSYGLVAERDLAGYITIAWMAGVRPPATDHDWMRNILGDPFRQPEDKVGALFALAARKQRERS